MKMRVIEHHEDILCRDLPALYEYPIFTGSYGVTKSIGRT